MWYSSFSVWLILLSIKLSRSIYVVTNGKISFLWLSSISSYRHMHYIYISLYIYIYTIHIYVCVCIHINIICMILHINPLLDILFTNIFSHSVGCLFVLLILSLTAKVFLVLRTFICLFLLLFLLLKSQSFRKACCLCFLLGVAWF